MELENITAQEIVEEGLEVEVPFQDHRPALVFICLGSLVMGLVLAYNKLWHLKESVSNRGYIDLNSDFEHANLLLNALRPFVYLPGSNHCKGKRCPTTPPTSTADQSFLYTRSLPSASHDCISI